MKVNIDDELRLALNEVANARIFFGHHSVGSDLIAGLRELAEEAGTEIHFVELGNLQLPAGGYPAFVHARPGRNFHPKEKIDDFFTELLELEKKWTPDVALMKLCYVDVWPDTDTDELADYYTAKVQETRGALGANVLMHVTTPLTSVDRGFFDQVKAVFGKGPIPWEDRANQKRQAFRKRIIDAFPTDPVFDLALAEATAPDGHQRVHIANNDTYYSLLPNYTDDFGHLNELGRRKVARDFALALTAALK